MVRSAQVCEQCVYEETCEKNCEAYMVLARMTVNLDDFNHNDDREQTHEEYLEALVDDLKSLTVI